MKIEQVWQDYQTAIKAFLHSKISNTADVDDLLQDILIKTYNNLHTVKSESSVKSWLFQIANHAIIDFYREKGRSRDLQVDELWYEDVGFNLEDALSPCIGPFISALPKESAELLTSIDIHGQSQKEYAQALGISYSTLKSRVQKSRGELRRLFEDCCHLSLDKHGRVIDCDAKSKGCGKC
ncbi:RNA polymerase sigma factor SigZ [Photobacterium sp. SDRW27]|uniref:RNA polymerase sigma factor SigZ n=1 Tax=Photobacterium obscurum TaxID=2829490 RepID=UPI002244DEF1|nr:RNA polymerase sigma factor SigZ [Photobacterium obscurum]MCW8329227.1 RNA polymerase sigma factor SigZ [Photobacterium obscurum]